MKPRQQSIRRRIGVFAGCVVTAVAGAGVAGPALPAAAAAPVRTGWWNTAPAGFFPTQTSSGQLAVSEGAAGPTAVAGLAYPSGGTPAGGAVLTLTIDGNSSFGPTQVQVCPVKETSLGWKAGGGQTGPPPAFDCSRSVAGQVASSGSSVAFNLGSGQAEPDGSFNLVVLPAPGALPFQMVADAPGPSSLAPRPTSAGAGAPAPSPAGGSQTAPAPLGGASSPAPDGSGGSTAPSDQGASFSPGDTGSGVAALPAPAAPPPSTASSAQVAPAPGSPSTGANGASAAALPPPLGATAAGRSSPTGRILGFAALLIVLVLYSEGFGVLGGRIRPLSSRYGRQPATGADRVSA